MSRSSHYGALPDGTQYQMVEPANWNGTLLLYSHGPVVGVGEHPWPPGSPVVEALVGAGYAVAGCATTAFWPLEENVPNQVALLDRFAQDVAAPARTICWGESIGGLMTATLVQRHASRFDGALSLCGPLSGAVATQNHELDCTFVFKTLLAPQSDLDVVKIRDPQKNLHLALRILADAERTPEGRARVSFSAAAMNMPGWFDPSVARPPKEDLNARVMNQIAWLRGIDLMVFTLARSALERRGGGNPSWNVGIDYEQLLEQSAERDLVVGLYGEAGLELSHDLENLASSERVEADLQAVEYFTEHIVFNGDLGSTPVVTLTTTGDGLVTPDHLGAYGDAVTSAGQSHLLRQLWVERGGHCALTPAEILTALHQLELRIGGGAWAEQSPEDLNVYAANLGQELNQLPLTVGHLDLDRSGVQMPAAFVDYTPPPFARRYDFRDLAPDAAEAADLAPG